ncbi:MAG: bactofilin family protein [Myxococcales bacterium]|jgi:cytoskeletal protein CcmA (bactofilin family)
MAIQAKEIEQVDNTIVGESILINGKLEGDEDLTVRGRVEGSITLTKTLIVEPSGVVKADATVRNAIISGVVVGNITASESVHLTREGRMVGDINSPRVIIVEGAAFRGRIDMGEVAEPRVQERVARPQSIAPARPSMVPVRPAAPVRPPAPPPRPPAVVRPPVPPKPVEVKPPAPPPPPPPPKPAADDEKAPMPTALAKRKVVVRRKK